MINFAIPGLYENFRINKIFLSLMKDYPEAFRPDIGIDALFGNFQFCIWDGGRSFSHYSHATIEQIEEIKNFYNDKEKLPMRFIFTNSQLKEEHLSDRFCNLITEICENDLNEIVVNSPLLEDYIRTNYPKYKIISSTTKCLKNVDEANNELNNDYFRVCLDYNLNHNFKFLDSLTEDQKDKVEFLINPICGANCLSRKKHYKLSSLFLLSYGKPYNLDFCNITCNNLYPLTSRQRNEITPEEIYNIYSQKGFSHFKMEGRTFNEITHICNLVRYMVLPEFQLFIISSCFKSK